MSHVVPVSSEALAHLLSTAIEALESDRETSRVCLLRALALTRARSDHGSASHNNLKERGGLAPWQIRRVQLYVQAHLSEKIYSRDLAASARLSSRRFFRAFRESFGQTPMAYLRRQRTLRAQHLMLSTCEPLSQIALTCGLCDQAHFSRVFSRIVGISPSLWRRHVRDDTYAAGLLKPSM